MAPELTYSGPKHDIREGDQDGDHVRASCKRQPIWMQMMRFKNYLDKISTDTTRVLDLFIAIPTLFLCGPLVAVLAMLIRFDSSGPAFFLQERVGIDRSRFRIVKLRTMTHTLTSRNQLDETPLQSEHDPRITRLGKLLRVTSLDELPQLWNVLRGEMSLVGPRPIIPEQLVAIPPSRYARFEVRPGVTGLSQVAGRRTVPWPVQLDLDCEYATRRSARLYTAVLTRTLLALTRRQDVYGTSDDNWRAYRHYGEADKHE